MNASRNIAIIGAGPAALFAAERLAEAGHVVAVLDRMPTPARKLLIAGRGGLNLTHSEPLEPFLARYGAAEEWLAPAIRAFPPEALRAWCEALGEETFVGSSGRVFPRSMKAVGLLRKWLQRLQQLGVQYYPRHHWIGWEEGALAFMTPQGKVHLHPDATVLALGGASWPRLGSDGHWTGILETRGVAVVPLRPANCGFNVPWTPYFRERFAGQPLKPLTVTHAGVTKQGEAMITAAGIEGGVIYALSASIRDAIARNGLATITLDLRPGMSVDALAQKLSARGNKSLSSGLRSANFSPIASALLHESPATGDSAMAIAKRLKALPVMLTDTAGITRAISSAGGISRTALTDSYMLKAIPGTFAAGEMLDWEAPTGGYLLQACFSTAAAAAKGVMEYVK